MSTNHTPNFSLCQWEADDQVLRTEFNEDNAKLDAALGAVAEAVTSKAEAARVEALAESRNCQACVVTYLGTGKVGSGTPNKVTFPHKPLFIRVTEGESISFTAVRGQSSALPDIPGSHAVREAVSWGENYVQWFAYANGQYSISAANQLNNNGSIYCVFAVLDLSE